MTQILKNCFCAMFSCALSVCAICFTFSDFGPLGKRKNVVKGKAALGLSSAYESNLAKSYPKFKHKPRSNFRISTQHQLQHLNQTSASRQNLKFKILTKHSFRISTKIQLHNLHKKHQWQNTNQTPASESGLNFNLKSLTKPCAQSLNKSLAL